jgi:hypothetical protein
MKASKRLTKDEDELNTALAILIANTRSTKRRLPLTVVSKWLDFAVGRLGSYSAVADRLGLSGKMLRQFSYVKRLTPKLQELVAGRKLDSVDAVAHLAMLSPKQQDTVARAIATGRIDTSDIRSVVQLNRANYSRSINAIIERVKKEKARREYVAEFVVRGNQNIEAILEVVHKYITPKSILRVELEGAFGRLVLTQNGKKQLERAARELGVSKSQVIPTILGGSVGNGN